MSKNARIRRATKDSDNPYKSMRRDIFENGELTLQARGLLGYILVKPDDWEISPQDCANNGKCGINRIYRLLQELREQRYVALVKETWASGKKKGQVKGYYYEVWESPYTDEAYNEPLHRFANAAFANAAFANAENGEHTNKEVIPIKKLTKKETALKNKQQQQPGMPDQPSTDNPAETQLLLDSDENIEIDSHSNKQPQNGTTADLASLGQNSTLAELTPLPDPTARPLDQVSNASHSNRKPEITAAGRAKRGQNNPSKDLEVSREIDPDGDQESTAPPEDAAFFLLCETMIIDFDEAKAVIEIFHEHASVWPTLNQCRLVIQWLQRHGRRCVLDDIDELGRDILKADPGYEIRSPFAYLVKIVEGNASARAKESGGYQIPDELAGIVIG